LRQRAAPGPWYLETALRRIGFAGGICRAWKKAMPDLVQHEKASQPDLRHHSDLRHH
jgi:hypothetical protein